MSHDADPSSLILTQEEMNRLILLFLTGRKGEGASKEEIATVVTWAEETRVNEGLLKNVLYGNFAPAPGQRRGDRVHLHRKRA